MEVSPTKNVSSRRGPIGKGEESKEKSFVYDLMRTSSGAMITSAVSRAVLLGILSVVIGLARNVVETKPTTAGGGNSPTAYKPASSSSFPSQKSSSSSNMAPAVSTMAPLTADIIGNLTLLDSKFSVPLVPALFGDPLKSSGSSDSRNDGTRFTSSSPARGLAALVTPTPDSSVNGCRPIKFNSDDFLDQIYMLLENYNVPVDEKVKWER